MMDYMGNSGNDAPKPPKSANSNTPRDSAGVTADMQFQETREHIHRQMLSSVSHDLKTPLASIIGSLEIHERMGNKLSDEKKATLLQTALSEAHRLDNFITNILDMAKLENSMVRAHSELCDIGHLVQDTLIRLGVRTQDVTITSTPTTQEPILYRTDSMLLSRAIFLILDNALKYRSATPQVEIRYGIRLDGLTIEVEDNGPGIPLENVDAIFSKYTRLVKQDHQNAGTGLGLSICRALVTLIGGTVNVKNGEKGGAIFTLHFPPKE